MKNAIKVVGARVHNLKNITVEIPKEKITVITGISGSGKSSLAFDTIYAEGQRRYVESLSTFARQFLDILEKPDVDNISGLSPALSIDQKSALRSPRSTVGTMTEIYDYLRLLFARLGVPHCHLCGRKLQKQTPEEIAEILETLKTKIQIFAPLVKSKKGEHKYAIEAARKAKFLQLRVDKVVMDLPEALILDLDKAKEHSLDVVVDNLDLKKEEDKARLLKSVKKALDWGKGEIIVKIEGDGERVFRRYYICPQDGTSISEIHPRLFSFNSPHGACQVCQGLGVKLELDPKLVIPNPRLSLAEGAVRPWLRLGSQSARNFSQLAKLGTKYHFDLNAPVSRLNPKIIKIVLYGDLDNSYDGVIPHLSRKFQETNSDYLRSEIKKYMVERICPSCKGQRLRVEILKILFENKNIVEISILTVDSAIEFFQNLKLDDRSKTIASPIISEILQRLKYLKEVGLSYLTLDRNSSTLAGGEAQRIRLATQLGSGLQGVIYILDEPSIGLHSKDQSRLLDTMKSLRNLGNTIIVVEHDLQTILSADHIIDVGPGAGKEGGKIIAAGTPEQIKKNPRSLTGQYLSGKRKIEIPQKRRKSNGQYLQIIKASQFNLKDIDVKVPLQSFVCVTGVSGSGKSTLIYEILAKALSQRFYQSKAKPGKHKTILGLEQIDKAIDIDQSPIGRTPRSNPATYTGVFTPIRELFTQTLEAKLKNFDATYFSFNLKGGRCENCKGDGQIKIEMNFLPDVYVACEICKGRRYNADALEIYYKDKNISDVLNMTVDEAYLFFKDISQIEQKLKILKDVGLGYVPLGQPATTLSGGEAQRVKLSTELSKQETGNTLYILDEPTTGLHFEDIKKLLNVLQRLVDKGNTVLVIEHNLDVIKSSDWVIDLGPEGGEEGGWIVAEGTPEKVAKNSKSYTGQYLQHVLKN